MLTFVIEHLPSARPTSLALSTMQLLDWVELARLSATGRIDEALQRACDLTIDPGGAEFCAAFAWRGRRLALVATAHGHLARAEVPLDALARASRREAVAVVGDGIAYAAKLGRRSHGVLFVRGGRGPDPVVAAISGFVATALARAEREEALVKALRRSRAERSELAQRLSVLDRLSSRASHDLKAPLVAIKGYVDMILRGMGGPIGEKTQRYLEKVNGSVDRMKDLIDTRVHPSATRRLADLSVLFDGAKSESVWAKISERDLGLLRRTLARCRIPPVVESSAEGVTIRAREASARQQRTLSAIATRAAGSFRHADGVCEVVLPRALR